MRRNLLTFLLACLAAVVVIAYFVTANWHDAPEIAEDVWVDLDSVDVQADEMAMHKSTHIKFEGVPIDGTLKQFVTRMHRAGFRVESFDNATAVLVGTFFGHNNCRIYVNSLSRKNLVSKIAVVLPTDNDWNSLEYDYNELKRYMTAGFGECVSCVEKFDSPYAKNASGKMHAVKLDQYKYETRFVNEKGSMSLLIKHVDDDTFVMFVLRDKENTGMLQEVPVEE